MKAIGSCSAMLLVACAVVEPGLAAVAGAQVVAQDLQTLRVSGKVSAVTWTRREDSCTLQVVLVMPAEFQIASKIAQQRLAAGQSPAPPATPKLPQVQAWLLKADGTAISRASGSQAFPAAVRANDGVPLEMKYTFPVGAAQGAVAVAIMVDGAYAIEQLRPFEGN